MGPKTPWDVKCGLESGDKPSRSPGMIFINSPFISILMIKQLHLVVGWQLYNDPCWRHTINKVSTLGGCNSLSNSLGELWSWNVLTLATHCKLSVYAFSTSVYVFVEVLRITMNAAKIKISQPRMLLHLQQMSYRTFADDCCWKRGYRYLSLYGCNMDAKYRIVGAIDE